MLQCDTCDFLENIDIKVKKDKPHARMDSIYSLLQQHTASHLSVDSYAPIL